MFAEALKKGTLRTSHHTSKIKAKEKKKLSIEAINQSKLILIIKPHLKGLVVIILGTVDIINVLILFKVFFCVEMLYLGYVYERI